MLILNEVICLFTFCLGITLLVIQLRVKLNPTLLFLSSLILFLAFMEMTDIWPFRLYSSINDRYVWIYLKHTALCLCFFISREYLYFLKKEKKSFVQKIQTLLPIIFTGLFTVDLIFFRSYFLAEPFIPGAPKGLYDFTFFPYLLWHLVSFSLLLKKIVKKLNKNEKNMVFLFSIGMAFMTFFGCLEYYNMVFVNTFDYSDPSVNFSIWGLLLFNIGAVLLLAEFILQKIKIQHKEVPKKYQYSNITKKTAADYIAKIEKLMKQDKIYCDPQLTVQKLAESLSVSRFYLSQIINEHMGTTFYDLVNHYRIQFAKESLAEPKAGELPVTQIALQAGFNSASTFYKLFKAETNQTPIGYRNEIHKQKVPGSRVKEVVGI